MIRGVKYISYAETSGYGLSAAAYIRGLLDAGIPVTWHPKVLDCAGYRPATGVEEARALLSLGPGMDALSRLFHAPIEYDTVVVHTTPEHWPQAIEPGKKMVGYTVWETDRLPLHWPGLLTGYDVILTPSRFSRDLFAPCANAPVSVVPHLPRSGWPDAGPDRLAGFRRRFGIENDRFLFYTINQWIPRKALWLALHAYLLAFEASDRTALLVKTNMWGDVHGKGMSPSRMVFDRIMSNYPDPAKVVFVPEDISDDDIGLLHLAGDAYLSLTRGEGFGMGAFDAATAGTPVITTAWSGHLDFLSGENACLVDYELRPVKEGMGNHVPIEQYWAHADLDSAIDWMQHLYAHPADARNRGAAIQAQVAERFDAATIMTTFLDAING